MGLCTHVFLCGMPVLQVGQPYMVHMIGTRPFKVIVPRPGPRYAVQSKIAIFE